MMTHEPTDRSLRQLFKELPQEQIPVNLNAGIMAHVCQSEQKRSRINKWWAWSAVGATSVTLIFAMIRLFDYLSIDLGKVFKDIFSISLEGNTTIFIYMIGGIVTLLLLFVDYRLRKHYFR